MFTNIAGLHLLPVTSFAAGANHCSCCSAASVNGADYKYTHTTGSAGEPIIICSDNVNTLHRIKAFQMGENSGFLFSVKLAGSK